MLIMNKTIIADNPIVDRFDYRIVKRLIDIVGSFLLFILFIPVYLIFGILIKLTSRGPVFYNWNVIGKNGKPNRGTAKW